MPHDKHGNPLEVGDVVSIAATVIGIATGEEYCNVNLDTVEPMYPGEHKTFIALNARQVEKSLIAVTADDGVVLPPIDEPTSDEGPDVDLSVEFPELAKRLQIAQDAYQQAINGIDAKLRQAVSADPARLKAALALQSTYPFAPACVELAERKQPAGF